SFEEYLDDSGFANGPRLVLRSEKMPGGVSLSEALRQLLKADASHPITYAKVSGFPGAWYTYTDDKTGQVVIFVAFTSRDDSTLNVFRWTVPGILSDATRPLLDEMLGGITFYAEDGSIVPSPTPPGLGNIPPTP